MMSKHQGRILLVEDNPSHARLIARSLESSNFAGEVVHMADGDAALRYLESCGARDSQEPDGLPDLVLLDLRLPKVDGLEVLRRMKQHRQLRELPVVVLSTSAARRDVAAAYERYANSYLVKPDDFTKLSDLLRTVGEYWMLWNTDVRETN